MKKWVMLAVVMILMMFNLTVAIAASESLGYDDVISCIYIESPEVEAGEVQTIGVILNENIIADDYELVYVSQTTDIHHVVRSVASGDDFAQFRIYMGSEMDTYTITEFRYRDETGEKNIYINDDNFTYSVVEKKSDAAIDVSSVEGTVAFTEEEDVSEAVAVELEEVMAELPVSYSGRARTNNIVIALDAGHDSSHAGAQADGIIEEIVTLKLAQYAKAELETYEGVTVYMTRTDAECPYPDTIGTASANDIMKRIDAAVEVGAQAVVSFHLNSYTSSSPNGSLVLCPQGDDSIAIDALELSDSILEKLCAVGFKNNGTRQEKWTITSYAKQKGIPGIIIEHGFISNPEDAAKLKDEEYIKAMGIADAQGIAQFYGLEKKKNDGYFHVGKGEYWIESAQNDDFVLDIEAMSMEDGADVLLSSKNDLLSQNFYIERQANGYYKIINEKSGKALSVSADLFENNARVQQSGWKETDAQLWTFVDAGEGYCYIQSKLGTYLTRAASDSMTEEKVVVSEFSGQGAQVWKMDALDQTDVMGLLEKNKMIGIRVHPSEYEMYEIMGTSNVTVEQMVACYNANHSEDYPAEILAAGGAETIEEFCQILWEEAEAEGVRAEVVFAQVILETGWLRFQGSVKAEWYNFAGLGAIDSDPAGNAVHFSDVREGLRAQVQHLKAYGSKEELNNECVDPRFHYVKRGCAEYIQWLGEQENPYGYGWATTKGYGNTLMKLVNKIFQY